MATLSPSQIATLSALETADQFVLLPGSFCATPFGGWDAHGPLSTEDKGVCARLLYTNKGTFFDCEVRDDKCLRKGTVETPVGYQSLAQALTRPVVAPPGTEQGSDPPAGGALADLLERLRSIDTTPQVQAATTCVDGSHPTPCLRSPS